MLQLDNDSPFEVAMAVFPDEEGVDRLVTAVQATFKTHPRVELAERQRALEQADRYAGDPARTGLVAAGELTLGKVGTDVLMLGDARAPKERPVALMAVRLAVAERKLAVAVFGDRRWEPLGAISDPRPFVRMPLTWERAFGGTPEDRDRARVAAACRNPVGVGLRNRVGDPLPNLEDPRAPITGRGDLPAPACFAPIAPSWEPRRSFAGTYDAAWNRRRAPYLPTNFDRRFFSTAPVPLCFDRFLVGGERVEAIGVSARGAVQFELPGPELQVRARVRGGWEAFQPRLQTVVLHPDDDEVTLTWLAALDCSRRLLDVTRVHVALHKERA